MSKLENTEVVEVPIIDDPSIAGGIYNYRDIQITIRKNKSGYYSTITVPEKFKLVPNSYIQQDTELLLAVCYNSSISFVDDLYKNFLDKIITKDENNN